MTEPMIKINKSDLADVESLLSDVKNGATKAMVTAINTTAKTTKVQVRKRLAKELNLKAKRIGQDLSVEKANYSKVSGAVRATGEPVGLVQFGARQTQRGVTTKVLKSSSRSLLKHAFIAKGKGKSSAADGSTKTHVWWRSGDRSKLPAPKRFPTGKRARANWDNIPRDYKYPLERLTGPRIEDILVKPQIIGPVQANAGNLLTQNLAKKVVDILRRHRG